MTPRARRLVIALVALDVVVVLAALGAWLLLRGAGEANVVNDGLRGSRPPADRPWPGQLASFGGIVPPFPLRGEVAGEATMLVATCVDCRSGDVFGGFLGRLGPRDLPADSRVVVLTWGGDQRAWVEEHGIDRDRFELHEAQPGEATEEARVILGIGPVRGAEESGIAFLHDTRGRWRSTYFLGQLDREDIAHDLERLAAE